VKVAVDQSGHHYMAASVDGPSSSKLVRNSVSRTHTHNLVAFSGYTAFVKDLESIVHGKDRPAKD
jgi:hypothetical protein